MSVHCYYHGKDLDGHCSAAIVLKRFPGAKLIPVDHDKHFAIEETPKKTTIFIVDFCATPFENMLALRQRYGKDLVWIDHHISNILEEKKHGIAFNGKREVGKGACQLVWEYLYPGVPVPISVWYLSCYDVWDHTHPHILPFQYGMRSIEYSPLDKLWIPALTNDADFLTTTITAGKSVLAFQNLDNRKYAKSYCFNIKFEGYDCIAVNRGNTGSLFFESVYNKEKHAMMVGYVQRPDTSWTVTLFSDDPLVDCSVIAKKYGGGGHKGAAGFQCEILPF